MNFWSKKRREHVADALRTVALGQLAYFGYQALRAHDMITLAITVIAASLIEGGALLIIREA